MQQVALAAARLAVQQYVAGRGVDGPVLKCADHGRVAVVDEAVEVAGTRWA